MANQNTLFDLSVTPANNLNIKGQSQQGTAPGSTIDNIFQRYGAALKAFYDSFGGAQTAGGTATALTLTVTEDWAAYARGLRLNLKAPSAATGAATLAITVPTAGALGAKAIRRQGDTAIQANDWLANGHLELEYDDAYNSAAGAWVLLNGGGRERLGAARTYYVRTDGSDSNSGLANTSGGAFLTVQKAIDVVSDTLDISIYDVTIQLAAGTYSTASVGLVAKQCVGAGAVNIVGDETTPSNVVLTTSGTLTSNDAPFLSKNVGTTFRVKGVKFTTTASGTVYCIRAINGSYVEFQNVDFGLACVAHVRAEDFAEVKATGNYTISAAGNDHWDAVGPSVVRVQNVTVTVTGTPAFGGMFANCLRGGIMFVSGITFSGSATGVRYSVTENGVIATAGGGASYLPGNSAGSTATGGQYN